MLTRTLPRPLALPRPLPTVLRPWLALAAFAGADALLLTQTGITLVAEPARVLVLSGLLGALLAIALIYGWHGRSPALSACASLALLLLALTYVTGLGSALVLAATQRPVIDHRLIQGDQWLGVDYPAWFAWEWAHPLLWGVLHGAYLSALFQLTFLLLYLPLSGRAHRGLALTWTLLLGLAVGLPISGWWPAQSAWIGYGVTATLPPWVLDWYHQCWQPLHAGTVLVWDWTHVEGLITLPSFHTVYALVGPWAVRRTRLVWLFVPLNALMLLSIPTHGGHYLLDMVAGALLAVGAMWGAQRIVGKEALHDVR